MADLLKQSGSYSAASKGGLSTTVQQSGAAAQAAQETETEAKTADEEATKAQSETESQAVLKHIAKISNSAVKNSASQAKQLSALSNQGSVQSGQLAAIAGSADVSNQLLTDLKIGQAYQLKEATNASQAIRQMSEDSRTKDRSISNDAVDSVDLFSVPGLAQTRFGGS